MKSACVPQKISKAMLIAFFFAATVALLIIGVTLLPVVGFVLALPVLAIGIYLFRMRMNDQCELEV